MGIKANIIRLLSSQNVTLTDFTLFGYRIRGQDYSHIAACVRNGHIQIVQGTRVSSTTAAYQRRLNCITVGSNPSENLVVHEATHAINDWHARAITATEDEGLAYVAQMIFVCRKSPDIQRAALTSTVRRRIDQSLTVCGSNRSMCNQATIGFATLIAATLRSGQTPTRETIADYRRALVADPATSVGGSASSVRHYNRIRRVEIPQAYLRQVGGRIVTD